MADTFRVGDKVQWESSQGTVHGTIKKKLSPLLKNSVKRHGKYSRKFQIKFMKENLNFRLRLTKNRTQTSKRKTKSSRK